MLRLISLLLMLTFSAQAFSQSCLEELQSQKRQSYYDRMSDDVRRVVSYSATVGGLAVGLTVATAAFPAFMIVAGIATSPVLVGEAIKSVQNHPIKRMMKLIKQSQALVDDPSMKPGGLLKRTHKQLTRQGAELTLEELARSIAEANSNNQCQSIQRVKEVKANIQSGILPVVEI